MPFDAQAPAEVTARDRMIRLRNFLETLPSERFDMGNWEESDAECGTVACIAGWHGFLIGDRHSNVRDGDYGDWVARITASLGLSPTQAEDLFFGGAGKRPTRPSHAVQVLNRYLETGEISWEGI